MGHPVGLELKGGSEEAKDYQRYRKGGQPSSLTMFHIVFALDSKTSYPVVQEYHLLCLMLAAAIRYEERWDTALYF